MKRYRMPPPLRAVIDTVLQDGAWWWVLECGHRERAGRWPADVAYRNCRHCGIDQITERARERQETISWTAD